MPKISQFDSVTYADKSSTYVPILLKTDKGLKNKKILTKDLLSSIHQEIIPITYSDLYNLKETNNLIENQYYRITDYTTTTTQIDTYSAGNLFDIIVLALDVNKLSENAHAVNSTRDLSGHFNIAKLSSWKLKYSLENDRTRFAWADTANGKGVIYELEDEWGNKCGYDFKNIQFKRKLTNGVLDNETGVETWVYTFTWIAEDNVITDLSIIGNTLLNYEGKIIGVFDNVILHRSKYSLAVFSLSDNVFISNYSFNGGTFYGCYSNTLGNNCYSNTFGGFCSSNTFGDDCYSNTFGVFCSSNTFGNSCHSNTFGNSFNSNTFGNSCHSNTFGNSFNSNTFGNGCHSNTFGNNCLSNTFGDNCYSNTFGGSCYSNTFGDTCYSNTFGDNYSSNTFGNNCNSNTFSGNCSSNTFGNSCTFLKITNSRTVRNIIVISSISGISNGNRLELYDTAIDSKSYPVTFTKDSTGKFLMTWNNELGDVVGKYKNSVTDLTWTSFSNTPDSSLIEITYSELSSLISVSGLTIGTKYLITDYQTVHEIPNSGTWDEQNQVMSTNAINTGQVEPLLVTAISVNELAPEAYSALFPDDVIYYSPTNDQTMVEGCTKGYIYRRIDTKQNNDIGFDYRNVKFRRYQIDVTTEHADGNATYLKRAVVKKTGTVEVYIKLSDADGLFSDTSKWKRFEWDNLMYISPIGFNEGYSEYGWVLIDDQFQLKIPTTSNYKDYYFFSTEPTINGVQSSYDDIYQNKFKQDKSSLIFNSNSVFFGNNLYNNTVGNYFYNNTVGNNFNNNTVGNEFSYNTVGNEFYSNTVGNDFNRNTVGNDFNRNTVGNNFNNNTVGNNFNNNTVGNEFSYNTVGNESYSNTVGNDFNRNTVENDFNNNTVGDSFNNNTVGNYFNYNSIGTNFNSNSIGYNFIYNTVGDNFYNNIVGNNSQANTVGDNFIYNIVGNYFQANTVGNSFNLNGRINFSLVTYVYQSYNKELYTNKIGNPMIKYVDEFGDTIILDIDMIAPE